jgi:stage III sporulation protein AF
MITFIKDWVLNIVTLVLFIVLIEIFVPSGRMRKYASLVTGFVLIIAIINPFLKLLGNKINLVDIQTVNSNFIDKAEIETNSKLLKDNQMKQIVEVYRKKIITQLEQSAKDTKGVVEAKADVIINEDYNSANFGEIKRAYLEINPDTENEGIKPVANVDKVNIGTGVDSKIADDEQLDPVIKKQLEDRIGNLFSIDQNSIVISRLKR